MPTQKILFPILNWGMGHASRSLPIINLLLEHGHQVTIASDGEAGNLLKLELPQLPHITLPSYRIDYSNRNFLVQYARVAIRTSKAIKREHKAVSRLLCDQSFDVIISDNRYGTYHPSAKNVIITHQMAIQLGPVFKQIASWQVKRYIDKFDFCWIPDVKRNEISGSLSAGLLDIPTHHIGLLSRFRKIVEPLKYDLAVVLSGPEPHRSILQDELISKLKDLDLKSVLVTGSSNANLPKLSASGIEVHPMLTTLDLNHLLCQSKMVICRSGYSSIMDLIHLGKRGILIPTPGQPEQQYLAKHHANNPLFVIQHQRNINIASAIQTFGKRTYINTPEMDLQVNELDQALTELGL